MIKQMRATGCYLTFAGPLRQQAAHCSCSERFYRPPRVSFRIVRKSCGFPSAVLGHELLPAVTKRIWLGIAILFLLMYISPGQFKKSSETNILIIPGKRGPELYTSVTCNRCKLSSNLLDDVRVHHYIFSKFNLSELIIFL